MHQVRASLGLCLKQNKLSRRNQGTMYILVELSSADAPFLPQRECPFFSLLRREKKSSMLQSCELSWRDFCLEGLC